MTKGVLVSDATTLIILDRFNGFELLTNLVSEIMVPQAVFDELTAKPFTPPSALRVLANPDTPLQKSLETILDTGESAAIALAKQQGLRLLIDEKKGRQWARQLGVEIIGFVGILLAHVYRHKLSVDQAREHLQAAQSAGMRLSNSVLEAFELALLQHNE